MRKAYLIRGSSLDEINKRCGEMLRLGIDSHDMYAFYENTSKITGDSEKNEVAVLFSTDKADFEGMTFDIAKELAGNNLLDKNFKKVFQPGYNFPFFGIIDLNNKTNEKKDENQDKKDSLKAKL